VYGGAQVPYTSCKRREEASSSRRLILFRPHRLVKIALIDLPQIVFLRSDRTEPVLEKYSKKGKKEKKEKETKLWTVYV
jgi:hypothetical protein